MIPAQAACQEKPRCPRVSVNAGWPCTIWATAANFETLCQSYLCMRRTQTMSSFVASIVLLSAEARSQPSPAPSHPFDLIHVSLDLTIDYSDLTFKGVVINTVVP